MQNYGNFIPFAIYIMDFERECYKKWLLFQHSWAPLSIQQGMGVEANRETQDNSHISPTFFFLHFLENLKFDST